MRRAARPGPRARRLDVPRQRHGQPRALRKGSARRPRPALHQSHPPALGVRRPGHSLRSRRGTHRLGRGRAHRTAVGQVVRVFLLHHATFSINSLCHSFGRRPFATGDQSRNLAWLAPLAFGEAWHNNHHAFTTSARHGLGAGSSTPATDSITGLERCHLAWAVVRISAAGQQAKCRSVAAV